MEKVIHQKFHHKYMMKKTERRRIFENRKIQKSKNNTFIKTAVSLIKLYNR